ncbi:hypothetical protein SCMC78_67640 [Streptomyces sp. CMC78]|uniref:Uncharacterized protein n=1 Tax=Streptomyces sp. CMC78 TaxID=3231512 RepID=A0AB33KQX0_9ACTN
MTPAGPHGEPEPTRDGFVLGAARQELEDSLPQVAGHLGPVRSGRRPWRSLRPGRAAHAGQQGDDQGLMDHQGRRPAGEGGAVRRPARDRHEAAVVVEDDHLGRQVDTGTEIGARPVEVLHQGGRGRAGADVVLESAAQPHPARHGLGEQCRRRVPEGPGLLVVGVQDVQTSAAGRELLGEQGRQFRRVVDDVDVLMGTGPGDGLVDRYQGLQLGAQLLGHHRAAARFVLQRDDESHHGQPRLHGAPGVGTARFLFDDAQFGEQAVYRVHPFGLDTESPAEIAIITPAVFQQMLVGCNCQRVQLDGSSGGLQHFTLRP